MRCADDHAADIPFQDVVLARSSVDERWRVFVHELRLLGELVPHPAKHTSQRNRLSVSVATVPMHTTLTRLIAALLAMISGQRDVRLEAPSSSLLVNLSWLLVLI